MVLPTRRGGGVEILDLGPEGPEISIGNNTQNEFNRMVAGAKDLEARYISLRRLDSSKFVCLPDFLSVSDDTAWLILKHLGLAAQRKCNGVKTFSVTIRGKDGTVCCENYAAHFQLPKELFILDKFLNNEYFFRIGGKNVGSIPHPGSTGSSAQRLQPEEKTAYSRLAATFRLGLVKSYNPKASPTAVTDKPNEYIHAVLDPDKKIFPPPPPPPKPAPPPEPAPPPVDPLIITACDAVIKDILPQLVKGKFKAKKDVDPVDIINRIMGIADLVNRVNNEERLAPAFLLKKSYASSEAAAGCTPATPSADKVPSVATPSPHAAQADQDLKYQECCPTLCQFGVPNFHEVHDNLIREIYKYRDRPPVLLVRDDGGHTLRMLKMPNTPEKHSKFVQSDYKHRWVRHLVDCMCKVPALEGSSRAATPKRDEIRMTQNLIVTLGRLQPKAFSNSAKILKEKIAPKLNAVETVATKIKNNLMDSQLSGINRCSRGAGRGNVFTTPEYCAKSLGVKKGKLRRSEEQDFVRRGRYKHPKTREIIPWQSTQVQHVFGNWIKSDMALLTDLPDEFDIVLSVDHGKGHSRATIKMLGHFLKENPDDEWDLLRKASLEKVSVVANARCRKDDANIIEKTYGKGLEEDLQFIKNNPFLVIHDGEISFKPSKENLPEGARVIPIRLFMAADLLMYNIALGKEGAAGWWCIYCKLRSAEWQKAHGIISDDDHWTVLKYLEHVGMVENGDIGVGNTTRARHERKGSKTRPLFKSIMLENYIFCVLHYMIGRANNISDFLIQECLSAFETYTPQYMKAEKELIRASNIVEMREEEKRQFHSEFDDSIESYQDIVDFYIIPPANTAETEAEKEKKREYDDAKEALAGFAEIERQLNDAINNAKKDKKKKKEAFDTEAQKPENGKKEGQHIRAGIEDIYKKYKIDRGKAFGGAFDGPMLRRLMKDAFQIVPDIKKFLYPKRLEMVAGKWEDIEDTLYMVQMWFECLDGVMAIMVGTKRYTLTEETYKMAERYVKKIVEIERYLGVSFTVKAHLLEDHFLKQFKRLKGFGNMDETSGEKAHQDQGRLEHRLGRLGDWGKIEDAKHTELEFAEIPEVQGKLEDMMEATKATGKRKRGPTDETVEDKEEQAKRRLEALFRPILRDTYVSLRKLRGLGDWIFDDDEEELDAEDEDN
jgi:hypothetical protein